MKRIGIIGGIGPASTVEYYKLLIKLYRDKLSTNQYPEMLLYSVNMTEMLSLVVNDKLDELVVFLKERIEVLEKSSVDYVVLASNTPHLIFEQLANSVEVKMISIVEETCRRISESGLKKVGLLGTKSTMTKGFYQEVGRKYGIEMVIPKEDDQNYVHEKYMGELVFNQIKPETKKRLIEVVTEMEADEGIEGIVLGGTELPLILGQEDFDRIMVLNTTLIHVNAILEKMMQ
jgi:aspartate racemase